MVRSSQDGDFDQVRPIAVTTGLLAPLSGPDSFHSMQALHIYTSAEKACIWFELSAISRELLPIYDHAHHRLPLPLQAKEIGS